MTGFVFDIWSALVLAGLVGSTAVAMWTLIPRWHGIPATPARMRWIQKALTQAKVQPGEMVVDLGAGDGRVLRVAAREYGARAVGYEIEPLHCAAAWLGALFEGVLGQVSIRNRDLYKADLSGADVVFMYLNPTFVANLQPALEQLKPGTRVVSLNFPVDGWEPSEVDIGYLIFTYRVPSRPGSLETYLRRRMMPLPPVETVVDEMELPVERPPSPND
ncbi:MAG: SAM-dependent methyltransferase [Anaerolineae bacterium]|jgi:SAM-dependent methyltransferase